MLVINFFCWRFPMCINSNYNSINRCIDFIWFLQKIAIMVLDAWCTWCYILDAIFHNHQYCRVPAEFRTAWDPFVESVCYVSSTYFVPYNQSIPGNAAAGLNAESPTTNGCRFCCGYKLCYSFCPIFFGVLAVMFSVCLLPFSNPKQILTLHYSGLNLKAIL